jgi:malonate transporter
MLAGLFNGVLPIFAISVIGYVCGRLKVFDFGSAMILNKFVMLIGMPVLGFKLLSDASLFDVPVKLLVGYLLSEMCVYLITFIVARTVFSVGVREAFLLGLATALTNHVLFILPIAEILIGPSATLPIVALISMDGMLIFSGTIVVMDIMSSKEQGWRSTMTKIASNPPILGMLAGLLYGLSGLEIAPNVQIFLLNISSTASPVLLFALGVILSVKRDEIIASLSGLIVFVKLIIHPVIAYFLLTFAFGVPLEFANPAVMVAAAPCGVMSFMLAMNYGVKVDNIARVIFISSLLSLPTISYVANI